MESKDILLNPSKMIALLCDKLFVEFDEKMLSWPKGYRQSDGIWAIQWYNSVIESTGFTPYQSKEVHLNSKQQAIVDECMPYYLALQKYKKLTEECSLFLPQKLLYFWE